jgi:hypothetical protein
MEIDYDTKARERLICRCKESKRLTVLGWVRHEAQSESAMRVAALVALFAAAALSFVAFAATAVELLDCVGCEL